MSVKMQVMEKKKTDRHKEKRVTVNLPISLYKAVLKAANKAEKPAQWYVMKLITDNLDRLKIDRPEMPWERDPEK